MQVYDSFERFPPKIVHEVWVGVIVIVTPVDCFGNSKVWNEFNYRENLATNISGQNDTLPKTNIVPQLVY